MGNAGPARLGLSRVVRYRKGKARFGTVSAFLAPWFEITMDNGEVIKWRKGTLAESLLFQPADFYDPRLLY